MKILMLARRSWPQIGGVEKHIKEVVQILKKKGHRVRIISGKDINYPHVKFLGLLVIWLWMLRNIRIFRDADIVHAHDVAIWYLPLRIFLPKKPFYVTFHGWEGKFPIPLRYKVIRKISEKMAWGNICVGRYLEKWYGIKANYVIYGGIDRKIKNANQNSKTILFLGRLQKDTGLLTCLKVFQLIKEKYPNMKILFLGDGALRKEAEKYGRVLGFQKNITPYLLKSRFVLTSGYLSMLEAMVARKLVFAIYDSQLKYDTLKMSPFFPHAVVTNNSQELVREIGYFLKNPKKEQDIVAGAHKWACQQTWDKVVNVYLRLWEVN